MIRLLLICALLFPCFAQAASIITATVTITNAPTTNGMTFVMNGDTRTWTNVVANSATQILTNNTIGGITTNLFIQTAVTRFTGPIFPRLSGTNAVQFAGAINQAMSASLAGNWGSITYSTQSVSQMMPVRVPQSGEAPDIRTNVMTLLTIGLSDYGQTPIVGGSTFASTLVGLTNAQTVAGAKSFTNAANLWDAGALTNAPFRNLQMHYYPSNAGIVGYTSGLDPGSVLAVDANGYFSLWAVNAVVGEPLTTPLAVVPNPENIINVAIASNKFAGLTWTNYITGTNRFTAIWNSTFKDGTGTNMTWNGGTGNTQTLVNPFITGNLGIGLSPMAHPASLDKGQTLTNGTAASADPVNGFSFWSSAGEWFYRSSTTSEGSGANNRIHNRAAEATGSGADYSLTTSFALASFGGTQAEFNTLPTAGTYVVSAIVTITAGSEAGDDFRATLFNATDGVVVPNSEKPNSTIAENAKDTISLKSIITITAPKRIQIYARNATAARGSVSAIYTQIFYERMY